MEGIFLLGLTISWSIFLQGPALAVLTLYTAYNPGIHVINPLATHEVPTSPFLQFVEITCAKCFVAKPLSSLYCYCIVYCGVFHYNGIGNRLTYGAF